MLFSILGAMSAECKSRLRGGREGDVRLISQNLQNLSLISANRAEHNVIYAFIYLFIKGGLCGLY